MSRAYAPPLGPGYRRYADMDDYDDRRDLDEADARAEAEERAKEDIKTAEYWFQALDGEAAAWRAAECLAACMKELDAACDGDTLALTAITTALSRLQRTGIDDAAGEPG